METIEEYQDHLITLNNSRRIEKLSLGLEAMAIRISQLEKEIARLRVR